MARGNLEDLMLTITVRRGPPYICCVLVFAPIAPVKGHFFLVANSQLSTSVLDWETNDE